MNACMTLLFLLLPSLATTGAEIRENSATLDDAINKICPIANEPNDGKTFVNYDGHKVGLCCKGCDKKFLAWSKAKKDAFVKTSLAGGPATEEVAAAPSKMEGRASEPYTLPTCPVTGENLGSMGDSIALTVEGREVRVCCKGCVGKVQKNPAKYFKIIDQGLVAQQTPYYPGTACVVSGEPLVEDGEDIATTVIVKNRLFRLCCKSCVRKLKASPEKYFAILDKAVKSAQRDDYPLETCLVREKSKLGSMGDPLELVVGNRLVRLCCKGCTSKFEKENVNYLATLDKAWAPILGNKQGSTPAKEDGHGDHGGHDKKGHDHKGHDH